jgi:hypothetical protein
LGWGARHGPTALGKRAEFGVKLGLRLQTEGVKKAASTFLILSNSSPVASSGKT